MITSVNDWLLFLRTSDALIGFPLLAAGAALMLFGWRMWKVCVMLSFGLIGMAAGAVVGESTADQALYAYGGAVVLGLLSYWPAHYAVVLLGGLLGSGIVLQLLSGLDLQGAAYWLVGAIAFIGCTGYSLLARRVAVIFVTAFLGAVLAMSGVTAFVMEYPPLYGTFRGLAAGSVLFVGFILAVPSVMSTFYQIAEVHRLGQDL